MPIENERKYVLDSAIEQYLGDYPSYSILQAYFPSLEPLTFRLRQMFYDKEHSGFAKMEHVFTIKGRNEDGTNTEIEMDISADSFQELVPFTLGHLRKRRYIITNEKPAREPATFCDTGKWELDVFYDHGHESYFWMAEYEIPEGQKEPDESKMPTLIKDHLLFRVPLADDRFSSKKLCSIAHATEVYDLLKKGHTLY